MFETIDFITMFKDVGLVGVLLGVLAYFVYKDYSLNKTLSEALNKFTVAINVLIGKSGE